MKHARILVSLLLTGALAGCAAAPAAVKPSAETAASEGRVHAVLVNGGGQREINFQSHLHHLQRLIGLLQASGVESEDIAIFNADGADPAADLATREVPGSPDFWLLPESGLMRLLAPPMVYVDSRIDGFSVQPARREALAQWFSSTGKSLGEGDTLLFYVTDHGERNKEDAANNNIVLWNETLSVAELRQLLAQLDPSVRVVMLMSQCFSGSFSNVMAAEGAEPSGAVCGYFSSTADRLAYGCYPENRGKEGVGHSFQFFEALEPLGGFEEAHRRVLVTDDTPDVPHTTTDFYLEQLLQQRAAAQGKTYIETVDELLAEAWRDRGAQEAQIRLLDSIGYTFGTFSPRSLRELQEQALVLPEFSGRLRTYGQRWDEALEALRLATFESFRAAHPEWTARLDPNAVKAMSQEQRQQLAEELLAAYVPYVRADGERYARLELLREKGDEAAAASYRAEVRVGVILRLRALLTHIAGEVYIQRYATPQQRQTYDRLSDCERLEFAGLETASDATALQEPEAFPPMAEERELVEAVMPAWMGVQYRPVPETPRQRYKTGKGAAMVAMVFADSPAKKAGLEAGDIVLGTPGNPFVEPHQMREWTMRSEIGKPEQLVVLRNGKQMTVTLRPGPYPLELPKMPGPPKVGSPAPPVKLDLFRGDTRLSAAKPRLLFFWATWCAICHASVPELLAFGAARGVEIVAVTDEDPEVLRRYFSESKEPFPQVVAVDPFRMTFQNFGVSGTPTFVLIDENGIVRHYQTGYSLAKGLTIEGWSWDRVASH